jgi:hypothetical protein
MADLLVDNGALRVRLSSLEKLGAMRGDITIPLGAITAVRVSEDPWSELRGIRAPGTGLPGVISLCTRRGSGFRDFAAVYGRAGQAVVVEASGAEFDRLVISRKDARTPHSESGSRSPDAQCSSAVAIAVAQSPTAVS